MGKVGVAKTILIADASPMMRRVVERSLRLAGLDAGQVLEASEGAEALSLARQRRLDLVLTDVNLVGMSGLEMLRELRQTEGDDAQAVRDVPVVIISSQAAESQVLEALSLGAQGYIRKPFTSEQIKEYILPLLA